MEGQRNRTVNTTEEMAAITNLSPGVNYSFAVIATNDRGPSSPSDPLAVRTLDEGKRTVSHSTHVHDCCIYT